MKILAVIGAFAIMILFAFVCGAIIAQQTDDEKSAKISNKKNGCRSRKAERKRKMTLEERIKRFMSLMTEATQETGITVAVEHGAPLVVFDLQNQEPINLEITVGTEVERKNGVTSITTFDKSQIEE